MQIIVNGENRQITTGYTAATLIEEMALGGKRIAMEINLEIVPRSSYSDHILQDGDQVEIVHAVGGG